MDFFQISEGAFSPVLLLPVIVVVGAVALFVFGFKNPSNPKFRKIGNEHSNQQGAGSISSSSNNSKRQKRNVTAPEATSSVNQQQLKQLVVTTKAPPKKEVAAVTPANEAKTIALNQKNKTHQTASNKAQTKKAAAPAKVNAKENKSNAKNTEKPLDDGGEWHTVVTKKQKKTATTNDLLIQAVAEAAAGASLIKSGAHEKKTPLKANNKQAKEQANKTKKATVEYQRAKDYNNIVDNKSLEDKLQITSNIAADNTSETTVLEVNVAAPPAEKPQTDAVEVIAVHAAEDFIPPAKDVNVVFDELGDAAWTEAKAPKKSKKRALRE